MPPIVLPSCLLPAGDFLLLLCASQQWQVFVDEQTEEWVRVAGDNREQLEPLGNVPNPVPNFINCRCVHVEALPVGYILSCPAVVFHLRPDRKLWGSCQHNLHKRRLTSREGMEEPSCCGSKCFRPGDTPESEPEHVP